MPFPISQTLPTPQILPISQISIVVIRARRGVLENDFGKLVLVGVADYGGDAWKGGDLFGSALGVASGDDDFGQRVLALHATNGGTCVLIGGGGNGARI